MVMPTMPRRVKSPIASNKPVYLTLKSAFQQTIQLSIQDQRNQHRTGSLAWSATRNVVYQLGKMLCGIVTLEDPVARRFRGFVYLSLFRPEHSPPSVFGYWIAGVLARRPGGPDA